MTNINVKRNERETNIQRKMYKIIKKIDKMFYNLWCDENIIYSTDDDDDDKQQNKNTNLEIISIDPNNNNNKNIINNNNSRNNRGRVESDTCSILQQLQSRIASKYEPPKSAKDNKFINEVFDSKQISNNGICVKVHSNILTISKKFIYQDEYFNNVYQQSQWKKMIKI